MEITTPGKIGVKYQLISREQKDMFRLFNNRLHIFFGV